MTRLAIPTTAFDVLLWAAAEQREGLQSLREAVHLTGAQLTIETVISDEPSPLAHIEPRGEGWELRQTGHVGLLLVDDERGAFVLGCWPTGHPGVWHLVGSAPTTDPRWRKVERWVANAAPLVVPVLLNHDDFADIGTALSEYGEVEVSRMTARRRADLSSISRGWKARSGKLRPTHHQVLSDAEAEGASVRTLSLHVADVLSLHLRRLAARRSTPASSTCSTGSSLAGSRPRRPDGATCSLDAPDWPANRLAALSQSCSPAPSFSTRRLPARSSRSWLSSATSGSLCFIATPTSMWW